MKLSYEDGKPIYEQIVEQIKYDVTKGYLQPGDAILSVRKMALDLQITPNTVAKAYQQLEQDGIIQIIPGKGTYIRAVVQVPQEENRIREAERSLQSVIMELKLMGHSKKEIVEIVAKLYDELA